MINEILEYNKTEAYRILRDEKLSIHLKGAAGLALIHCYYEVAIENLFYNDELQSLMGDELPSLKEYAAWWLWANSNLLDPMVQEWLSANLGITAQKSRFLYEGHSSFSYPEVNDADQ